MSEIRNLTRNGETFYPQTHVEGVLDPEGEYIGYYVDNPEWIRVITDHDGKILAGIKSTGEIEWSLGVPQPVKEEILKKVDKEEGKSLIDSEIANNIGYKDNSEFIDVKIDSEDKILEAIKTDGTKIIPAGIEIRGNKIESIEDLEGRSEMILDGAEKIISYRKPDGIKVENVGIETNKLVLTTNGMSDFQKALKDSGFQPGGSGDWSDATNLEIPMPRCTMINITSPNGNAIWPTSKAGRPDFNPGVNAELKYYLEFWDMAGNYFKKEIIFSAQGNSTMEFIKKNGAFDICNNNGWDDDDTFKLKIGNWVSQGSFHIKANYCDYLRGASVIAYQVSEDVYKTRGLFNDVPWKKALIDFDKILSATPAGLSEDGTDDVSLQIDNGARCMPDGFPCIVYLNGEFYGIYSWQLKKHRDNYHMNKKTAEHIHLDGDLLTINIFYTDSINWEAFEVRNPKNLYCMDGSKYDGDYPKELIDSTSEFYDSTNKDHKNTAKVKKYIVDLSTRVKQITRSELTLVHTNNGDISIGDYGGNYNSSTNFSKGVWVKDSEDNYFMSIHTSNIGNPLSDENNWINITDNITLVRQEFEKYFDVDNIVDYQLINMAVNDTDGFGKNWQWTTWDGVKWYVNQYDKDMSFGNLFNGMFTRLPSDGGWLSTTTKLPTGIAVRYYQQEHISRWKKLVSMGVFTKEHISKKIMDWVARIGQDNFKKEWDKWPESPCNRDSLIDFEHWKFTGNWNNTATSPTPVWDSETAYSVGDRVWYTDGWHLEFESVKENLNKPCTTGRYSRYPANMGYRDSVWRFIKFIEENIENQDNFINSLN